jgi:hypothetical protein
MVTGGVVSVRGCVEGGGALLSYLEQGGRTWKELLQTERKQQNSSASVQGEKGRKN